VTRWTANPQAAAQEPIVKIGSPELAFAAGLSRSSKYASFDQLVGSKAVLDLMDRAREAAARDLPRSGALGDAEKLEQRLEWMQRFLQRQTIRAMPVAGATTGPASRWNVAPMYDAPSLAALASGPRLQGWPEPAAIDREITYNRVRPWGVTWVVLVVALLASIVEMKWPSKILRGVSLGGLLVGFGFMTWGIAMRWMIGGRVPASNMYESLLVLGWGVSLFAVIAFAFMRNRLVVMNANAMAALTMLLVDLLPMDRFIHPVPPVLAGTAWLAIHVSIIMVGYSVLTLSVLAAHLQIGFTIFSPKSQATAAKLSDLNYWYMHVGSILLMAGILTGSVWAASSWGRYWGWDPKEVWSLVAFLAYMAIMHARWEKWISPFTIAALSIVAYQMILMTYLGVNYVLGTGLHSYGFGDSPVLTWMVVVLAAEIAFLAIGYAAYRRRQPRVGSQLAMGA
jgi:cytochrome c-type biogenesis protein CcsB